MGDSNTFGLNTALLGLSRREKEAACSVKHWFLLRLLIGGLTGHLCARKIWARINLGNDGALKAVLNKLMSNHRKLCLQ